MTAQDLNEFSGTRGKFFAWFLTSPLRRVLEWKMGKPDALIIDSLQLTGSERVLDSGSGSGFHTIMIAEKLTEGKVVAVDISPEMIERLKKNTEAAGVTDRVEPRIANCLELPFEDESFDRAVSAAAWHHLPDPQKACDEMVRTLKAGGILVVNDLAIGDKKAIKGFKGHDKRFLSEDMEQIMRSAGLHDIRITPVGRWLVGVGTKPVA